MKINKEIFREYDIRGIYGTDIDENISYLIGKAFASIIIELGKKETLIAYDNRASSPIIYENLVKGILETGIDVTSIELATTPMYYYASNYLNINCGIMITASHNPKEYNGFKISYNGFNNAYGKDVMKIYERIIENNFYQGTGKLKIENIKQPYINLLTKNINYGQRKIKLVIDCGNGTTSIIAKDIFNKIKNLEYIGLYTESDPNFPNHHPDPSVEENMQDLKKKVLETKSDLGLAFDGDGDRVGVVDEKGNMIDIDKYMIIIWRDLVNKVSDKRTLYDVKCSKVLEDELDKLNVEKTLYRTGNSYMKAKMVEGKYPFGGELSGHVFFQDKFPGYDDGIYAGLRLIEILSHTDKTVSQLLDNINTYYSTKELKIHIEDSKKQIVIDKIKEYCIKKEYNIITIDGVKVIFEDGFALIRASNTGPNITIRYEGKTEKRLKEIKDEFDNLLNKIKEQI